MSVVSTFLQHFLYNVNDLFQKDDIAILALLTAENRKQDAGLGNS